MREWNWTVGFCTASPTKKEVIHYMAWGPGMVSSVVQLKVQLIYVLQDIYFHSVATLAEWCETAYRVSEVEW